MPKRSRARPDVGSATSVNPEVIPSLLMSFAVLVDPRKDRGKRYTLFEVLVIAVLGCVCGCDNAEALQDWAEKEKEWLSRYLTLQHGTPSQDVFLRVLAALDPTKFREAFLSWVRHLFRNLGAEVQIAVDGQTNRGSGSRASNRKPVHMVSALTCGDGLVIGQVKTDEKSNEITAIPELLSLLDLRGALVSIDAMGCQVSIAKLITSREGDYLLGLKGNQSSLRDETEAVFEAALAPHSKNVDKATPPTVAEATEVDKGHGRLETRKARVITDFAEWVPSSARWPEIKSLIAIDAVRENLTTGKIQEETRNYISSRELTPKEAIAGVRQHWLVETQLHWCLDVTFGQDANQTPTKHAAENLAVVRHIALNLVRQYGGDRHSIPRRRRLCDYKLDYRERLLGLNNTE